MLRRINYRVVLGGGLMLFGALLFLEQLGFLQGAFGLFWGALLIFAGLFFAYIFFKETRFNWWAIIPAFALLGLGADVLLPRFLNHFPGGLFLAGLGLSFFTVYITDRSRWWGIIPGGVLLSLALISILEGFNSATSSGSLFFLGLGLTFLLVAVLPNPFGHMQWAYIPAVVLMVMGGILAAGASEKYISYLWPAGLIIVGILVLVGFFRRNEG